VPWRTTLRGFHETDSLHAFSGTGEVELHSAGARRKIPSRAALPLAPAAAARQASGRSD